MPTTVKAGSAKGNNKRSSKPSTSGSTSKAKKSHSAKPAAKPEQQKTKSKTSTKKKPPHLRYTEKELKIPTLNGINPAGVQKAARAKKGKKFVEDRESMNAIMAMVMAEKEGNIESKTMRARQLEEVREARKAEMEKRSEHKKAGLEERKRDIKQKGKRRHSETDAVAEAPADKSKERRPKKRVSFG
ncbi:hypothetical protein B0A50_06885 [Salinomyces thailandicus]|uniref:60S ribosomal subunit assembly/export protein LOC1 n=1 Tax=Salinomyces thailandicus TaxID=706561 RepID=A0A4U0TQW3_9PEZI|nr:hypothetical protein B0A50_06885 [Salinomyces thailandica]